MVPRLLVPLAAALTLALSPTAALAKSVPVTAQVVGSPYVAGARSVVPVVLSSKSARSAHLRSPLGVFVVSRTAGIAAPAATVVRPGGLRVGDALKATVSVGRSTRSSFYPRMTASSLRVTKRSTQPSTAEIEAILQQHAKQLAALAASLDDLGAYTRRGFADVNARLAALQSDIDALKAGLRSVQVSLTDLAGQLTAARTELLAKIDLVTATLQPQIDALAGQLSGLVSTIGSCGPPATGLAGDVCTLSGQVSLLTPVNLSSLTSRVDQISSALTTTVNQLTGLTLTGDLPANLTPEATALLTGLFNVQGTVGTLQGDVSDLGTRVTILEGLVGGVNVGTLSTTVSGLTGKVSGLITTLGTDPTGLNSTVLGNLQAQVTSVQSGLTGLTTTVTGQGTQLTTLQGTVNTITGTTIPALSSKIDTVCTSWRTTLSGASLPVLGGLGLVSLPVLPGC
jgi:trimeric autotransporter adhesin